MPITEPSIFGALLRQHRVAAGLTQEALAERAGLSVRAVSNLERGERRVPYPHTVRQLARALRLPAVDRARLEATIPPRRGSTGAATNLPLALTSFVGRDDDLAAVRRLLGAHRLVTLTGAGGVGKTRLALAAARAMLDEFPDGVWLVELASLADPALAPLAVARVLGVHERPGRPLTEMLADWLVGQHVLLVLDNCEHVLDACAALADALLQRCARLRILATSREALGLTGELAWRVPSLATPAADATAAHLASIAAVALFLDRVRAGRPDFAVTAANAAAVVAICRRLDGIPLALELAASRARLVSVDHLVERLDDRFRLLTGGSRAALPRQQTLRATVDWSHDLLTEPERRLFRRLAVFAGGWTLEAAEAVCAGDGIEIHEVLDVLGRLVDKSLVLADDGGATVRFQFLETLRQYAGERLREADEASAVGARHRDWCLALAERAEPQLEGAEMHPWLARLDAEHDNLRAALAWCLAHDPAGGLRLAGSLTYYWFVRSHVPEGRRWLELLLARAPARTAARVTALQGASYLARLHGDHALARERGEERLAVSRELGEARLIARSLVGLGAVCILQGDLAVARALLEEGVVLSRADADRHNLGELLYFQGRLAEQEADFGRARALYEESRAVSPYGNVNQGGYSAVHLGLVTLLQGDAERAEAWMHMALALARRLGSSLSIVLALGGLGQVAAWRGDLERAARLGEESLALAHAIEYGSAIAAQLVLRGRVACRQGDRARASAWLGEGLARSRAAGDAPGSSAALLGLGLVTVRQGDAAGAMVHLVESLVLRRQSGNRLHIAECLEAMAMVASGTDHHPVGARRATRLLGAASSLRVAVGAPLPLADRPDHKSTVLTARVRLGEAAFDVALAEGEALTPEEAIAEALTGNA